MTHSVDDYLEDLVRSRTDHIGMLAKAMLDTRTEMRRERSQSSPRIEVLPAVVDQELIDQLTMERDQLREEFMAVTEQATALAIKVHDLEIRLAMANLDLASARRALDASDR